MPSKAKSVSLSKKLQPVYWIDRTTGSISGLTGNTGFGWQFLLELVVHVEHIAGAYDVALADFKRRRMHHWPGGFGGGAGKYTLAAGHGGFVTGRAVGFTGIEDEGGLAVEAYVFGDGLSVAQVGEERERDGRCDGQSRRRRLAEIGKGTDYIEVAVFTGDFIECHGGLLLLGVGSSENFSDDLTGALELGKAYVYSASLMFIFPGEIPSSDSTKSSPSSSTINEFPVLNIKLYNPS